MNRRQSAGADGQIVHVPRGSDSLPAWKVADPNEPGTPKVLCFTEIKRGGRRREADAVDWHVPCKQASYRREPMRSKRC